MLRRLLLTLATATLCGCGGDREGPREAAGRFFGLCNEGKFDAAYEQASSAFKFARTAKYFEARVRDLGLDTVKGVEWGELERSGKVAKIRGRFILNNDSKLPLNFSFVEEGGRWRLLEARTDPAARTGEIDDVFAVLPRSRDRVNAGAAEVIEPSALSISSQSQLQRLAEETLLKFNDAVQNGGDFTMFYEGASDRWKYRGRNPRELAYRGGDLFRAAAGDPLNEENRLTVTALRRAFDPLVEAQIDLSSIKGAKMILSTPARINSDGVLRLTGTFDRLVTQGGEARVPRVLDFSIEYVFESSKWKLFGISVNLLMPRTPGSQ